MPQTFISLLCCHYVMANLGWCHQLTDRSWVLCIVASTRWDDGPQTHGE